MSLSQSQQRLLLSRVEEEHDDDNDDNDNDDGGDDGGDIYGDGNYDQERGQSQRQGQGQGRGRAGEEEVSAPVAVDAKSLRGMSTAQVQGLNHRLDIRGLDNKARYPGLDKQDLSMDRDKG